MAEQKIRALVEEQVEKAQATTAGEMAEEVMEELDETGEKAQTLPRKSRSGEECSLELAESLKNASDELGDFFGRFS